MKRLLFLMIIIALTGLSSASLVAYYPLNETSGTTVFDYANNYDGTNTNAEIGVLGVITTAYNFTGLQNVQVSDTAALRLGDSNFTISVWAKSNNNGGTQIILEKQQNNGQSDYTLLKNSGYYTWRFTQGDATGGNCLANFNINTTIYADDSWQNTIAVFNSDNQSISVYANGNLVNTTDFGSSNTCFNWGVAGGPQNLYFGMSHFNNQFGNASIDEVRLYNDAKNSTQVNEIYLSGSNAYSEYVSPTPSNGSSLLAQSDIVFNATSYSIIHELLNITLFVDGTLNQSESISGFQNQTTFNFNVGNTGTKNFFLRTCNTNNVCTDNNITFIVTNSTINSVTYNTTAFETGEESFVLNVSYFEDVTSLTALLNYNGTNYSTTESCTNNVCIVSTTLQVPLISSNGENRSFSWFLDFGTLNEQTQNYYQVVNETVFTLCDATYATKFLNISFKDESDLTFINASIPTSTFTYYLGSGTINKTYNLVNNTNNDDYSFCATPNRTLYVNPYVQYKQGTAYPQRVWQPDTQTYTNSSTDKVLYLLGLLEGQDVTIQVINSASQTISGVDITISRVLDSTLTEIASGTTGDAGSATFFLNPNFVHTFVLEKTGFSTVTTSFAPTETGYTITLGGGTTTENSTVRGIDYSFLPTDNFLVNDTTYTFSFNLTSSYWDVTEYGFSVRFVNGTTISGGSSTVSGTQLTVDVNTGNQTIIYVDAYWLINGVYTNITRTWGIQNSQYTDWSIKTFFTDFQTYIASGMFGLDNFGRIFIAFIIIFISVGLVSYKFGVVSPLSLATTTFGIVFLLDVALGFIPTIRGINYLPTFIAGLILVGVIMSEVSQR